MRKISPILYCALLFRKYFVSAFYYIIFTKAPGDKYHHSLLASMEAQGYLKLLRTPDRCFSVWARGINMFTCTFINNPVLEIQTEKNV